MKKNLAEYLRTSIQRQESLFTNSLILNPVENVPLKAWLKPASGFMHGLYSTDKLRDKAQQLASKIQFAGRRKVAIDTNVIYKRWCELLGASNISMRLLSGLHAHIIIFMAIGNIGDTVLLLPESAGGHMSTKNILLRLGYKVIEFEVDHDEMKVDVEKTKKIIAKEEPDFIFVDRSEGLVYEDFQEIVDYANCYTVFDASQYLTNIMSGDFSNPFDMGFDLIISTIHKNFPGPQKAVVFTKNHDKMWDRIIQGMSSYVSNFHVFSIYIAGLAVTDTKLLNDYSRRMIENSCNLEQLLLNAGVPVVVREATTSPTHHVWIKCKSEKEAFSFYSDLEFSRIITNYRKLPYNLGYGIRIGTSAATFIGLQNDHVEELAACMSILWHSGRSLTTKHRVRDLIKALNK